MNRLVNHYFFIVLMVLLAVSKGTFIADCIFRVEEKVGNYDIKCYNDTFGYCFKISCHGQNLSNLNDIKINFPFISQIKFLSCSFTNTANVQSLVRSLNLNYKTIYFEDFNSSFNRINFQNLSVPELYLFNSNISELPFDQFYDVSNVRALSIVSTHIYCIPKDFFNVWAENLLKLNLSRNKLRKIARKDFAYLVNLVILNLTENQINEIESGAFDKLRYLESLNLSSNQLYTLPSDIFHQLKKLEKIDLSFYPRSDDENYVKSTISQNLTMIQLNNLAPDIFKGMSNLRSMILEGHNLQILPSGVFDNNKCLEKLSLVRNNLMYLPVGIFKELKNLKHLFLDENQLTTLVSDDFMGLYSLQELRISRNNLTKIDILSIMHSKRLQLIDLALNQITVIQQPDKNDRHFQNLYGHTNRFTNTPGRPEFAKDWIMNLSFNGITEFNLDTFSMGKRLILDLRNNNISKMNLSGLSSDKFHDLDEGMAFISIILANNPWHCNCRLMDFARYLNDLSNGLYSQFRELKKSLIILPINKNDFSKEYICSSPSQLKGREVQKINLEEFSCLLSSDKYGDACNKICTCREYPGKRVLSIDCSYRNLKQWPTRISNLYNWSIELNMTGNTLKSTPSVKYSYLIAVTKLDLSSNNITEVSLATFSPALQDLKLHNNSISRLNKIIIEYLVQDNSLNSLTIHKNKWICDCETYKLLRSFNQKKRSSYNFNNLLCYGTNRTIYEIAESELCEDAKILIVAASSLIVFFGILTGCLAALYYRYQQQIKIWLYSRHLCFSFITDDELDKDKTYDAFISFSHKDEDFVEKEIVGKLEEGPRPYKLCVHYRDWIAGEWIPLQVSRSVADSKRTVIILTPNFLKSVWGLVEFRTAHTQALKDGRARLIVILYGEIGNFDDVHQELKDYLSLNTYIKWGDPWFWQKLKYALPHRLQNS